MLFTTGQLQLWHLNIIEALSGLFETFQGPANTALTSKLLPEDQYTRASGLRSIADNGGGLIAPFLAGFLLVKTGIVGVMLVDLFTLSIAIVTLLIVKGYLVQLAVEADEDAELAVAGGLKTAVSQFKNEMTVGFRYIRQRPGLMGLMLIYTSLNFIDALAWLSLLPVMILARSDGDEMALASVEGAFGLAGILGGLLVAVCGGPRRKIHGTLLGPALSFLLGGVVIAIGRTTPMWMLGAWMAMIFVPILSGSEKAIWQSNVELSVQGRVFSVYNMFRQSMIPFGMLVGGWLADSWFGPAMMPGGALVPIFSRFVGIGEGAGIAVLFLLTAFIGCAISLSGYFIPAVRHIEDGQPQQVQVALQHG
jgi:MFS family permease